MANSTRDNRRRNRTTSHQTRSSSSRRGTRSNSSSRARSTQGQSRRGTLTRPDTGYSLRTRRVRREPGGAGVLSFLLRPRVLIFILILVVVAVVMVVGVSSCIRRGNESTSQKIEEAKPKNEQDERVAAGVSGRATRSMRRQGNWIPQIRCQPLRKTQISTRIPGCLSLHWRNRARVTLLPPTPNPTSRADLTTAA